MTDEPMPPHDHTAEQSVLGAMLTAAWVIREVEAELSSADFYRPAHAAIYRACLGLAAQRQPVDPVTVADALSRDGELERVGGPPYLLDLAHTVPTPASAGYYAQLVAEKATMRRLVEAGTRIAAMGHTGADGPDVTDLVERARAELDKLSPSHTAGDVRELDELLPRAFTALTEEVHPGYATGFHDLDQVLGGGLHPGTLTVVGARPGVGKSILCLQLAAHAASTGQGALMVSLEMSEQELMHRFIANEASVELGRLHAHRLDSDDWRRVEETRERAAGWPLAVADTSHIGLPGITARARDRAHTPRGLTVVVVDYLQLVAPADPRAPREQQVSGLSRGLKLLARELDVAVVAAAQLNRGGDHRGDRRPVMSDLRESGSIEADADNVWLLHDAPETQGELEVIIAKNRQGPRGSVNLAWAPYYARAASLAPHLRAV